MENNVIADNGLKRDPAKPVFRLTGDIAARKFDPRRYASEITVSQALPTRTYRAVWSVSGTVERREIQRTD